MYCGRILERHCLVSSILQRFYEIFLFDGLCLLILQYITAKLFFRVLVEATVDRQIAVFIKIQLSRYFSWGDMLLMDLHQL